MDIEPEINDGLSLPQRVRLKMLFTQMNGQNIDLFKDSNLENNLHKLTLHSKLIKNDIKRNLLIKHHGNLNICIRFKAVKKIEYIECLIKRIEIAK